MNETGKVVQLTSPARGGNRNKTANRFNNFRQREYDYDRLEQELLNAQNVETV